MKGRPKKVQQSTEEIMTDEKRTAEQESTLSKQLAELTDIVLSLSNEMKELREKRITPSEQATYKPKTHVPQSYLDIAQEVLGPEFGLESRLSIEDYGPQYAVDDNRMLHIIIPDKYITLTEEEKKMGLRDIRSKVIDDENNLRIWCEQVRNNIMKHFQQSGKPRQYQLN